jgi:hypothetical protein
LDLRIERRLEEADVVPRVVCDLIRSRQRPAIDRQWKEPRRAQIRLARRSPGAVSIETRFELRQHARRRIVGQRFDHAVRAAIILEVCDQRSQELRSRDSLELGRFDDLFRRHEVAARDQRDRLHRIGELLFGAAERQD